MDTRPSEVARVVAVSLWLVALVVLHVVLGLALATLL